ncbi:hypothetical protein EN859_024695 [Mesorhizobium sp. M00.F.Ca.ET.216.01.1.1]|uniref:hypothetical protein n=1 Tax=Mesorhizobium sp. TaxID=1871066 RepID=UPI000FDB93C7|nr:hypothetical protein [Mesorhizobium sp.]TGQ34646.1 hypothetical protein EN859_024695 [Mesorhizobium sp. M00.F.Ca.ET.216.01.1.1]TIS54203.1 MAG: hypothetical protein E5W91_27595 [Mesorhizobium sp.]TIS88597.1 MAG: hypothetical protein E5W89_19730 [Mesorhizobium sp.]TJW03111.1 MAG: hypothetical protein E5W82_33080 [Mesorhizobium sp.]TJW40122.1 MAG: hypothetical protein E5W83_29285 [Mesorhizobium sp.]
MKVISAIAPLICSVSVVFAGGCASPLSASVDTAKYSRMSCSELNVAMGDAAADISRTAVNRGKVAQTNIPTWLWGGQRVAAAVTARQSARIEQLQQQEAAIAAARRSRC